MRSFGFGLGAGILYFSFLWLTLPDIADPRSLLAAQSTVITDRNGVELYRLFQEEDRTYVDGESIPQHMKDAIVAIEDERFHERGCLDMRAIARAVFRMGKAGGASTLTRQLARNALDLKNDNVYNRKLKELILGCQLEAKYDKSELLVLYLNWIPFGQNAYGIEQASQKYFASSASGLTLAQSAVLAALPQRPSYFSPYGAHRNTVLDDDAIADILNGSIRSTEDVPEDAVTIGLLGSMFGTGANTVYVGGRTDQVLRNMREQGFISKEEEDAAVSELLTIEFTPSRESIRAAHFVLWVKEQVENMFAGTAEQGILERGGLTIETTLDWRLQEAAEKAVGDHREDLLARFGAHNAALLSVDPSTREILSYVGNTDYADLDHGGKIDMVRVPRQPGSSFKPIVYAAAFEKGYGPATVLFDVKTKIGDNEPQNFDGTFLGPMTIRKALGASRNIPAAKAFFLAGGEEEILRLASGLGAPSPSERREVFRKERGSFEYGWPLSLGAAETPLSEMLSVYAAFGDGGIAKEPVSIKRIVDKNGNILFEAQEDAGKQILDERIAYQITSILSDQSARPTEFWQSQLTIPGYQTAAKTGTSNKCLEWASENVCRLRKPDNGWVLGYTPALVAGVWIGNADSSALFDKGDGLNSASPIWKQYMIDAHRILSPTRTSFSAPEGIVQPQVSLLSGKLPSACTPIALRKPDVFLKEHAPTESDPACAVLQIDKVTKLLASDTCPIEAREEGNYYVPKSILPDRWPDWERGVQAWVSDQKILWDASETHSGSLLPLPLAPTEACDPALTPGRLQQPKITVLSPREGGTASFPAFTPEIDYEVGSSVREVRYLLDGKRVAIEEQPPFVSAIRVPRSIEKEGNHILSVELTDEYYNTTTAEVNFRFDEDRGAPDVRILSPAGRTVLPIGSTLSVRAEADDGEGDIRYVQFYLNDTLLTTKPTDPYELRYVLDHPAGTYVLRAVAEDMAEHTGEDEVQIILIDKNVSSDTPTLLAPTGSGITVDRNEIIDVIASIPPLGDDLIEILVTARLKDQTEGDLILRLSEGEGVYSRTWKADHSGDYSILLETEHSDRTIKLWDSVDIVVK